ncbi:ring finger protein-like [Saccopteryx leptura]|uniref:ring finger protein-like n=1 Tax=Saccopteryx leptura TaxID=249018 RepID=UPI00339C7F2E
MTLTGQGGRWSGEDPERKEQESPSQAGVNHPLSPGSSNLRPRRKGVWLKSKEGEGGGRYSPCPRPETWGGPSGLREIPVGAVGQASPLGARLSRSVAASGLGWAQEQLELAQALGPQRSFLLVEARTLGEAVAASRTPDSEPLLKVAVAAPPWAGPTEEDEDEECPICAEPYGPDEHRLVLLNCGHGLCSGCLHRLLGTASSADLGRVRCPLCRQKTPMLEWEICRLQEELLQADGPPRPPSPPPPALPRRGSGPWAHLEHRYQLRFLAGPVGSRGCLPFLPCPPCLGARLWALRAQGPCARRLALLGLLALELLGLLLIFTPLMLLGLLFMLLDRSRH